jgi:hypothetical protein
MKGPAGGVQRKAGFFIGVTCPGCGGQLELEDNFFVLVCGHCGSNLKVIMPEKPAAFMVTPKISPREIRFAIDRFLKENDRKLTGSELLIKSLLYPYWKIDGVMLKIRTSVEKKVIYGESDSYRDRGVESETLRTDTSLLPSVLTFAAGPEFEGIPASLGMRTEYITIVPFSDDRIDDDFSALPVTVRLDHAKERAIQAIDKLTNLATVSAGPNKSELLNPAGSIVYFPYIAVETYSPSYYRFLLDGLTGRVAHFSEQPAPHTGDDQPEITEEFGALTVDFHRCVECGEDLPAGRSYVNICDNCSTINRYDPVTAPDCVVEWADGSYESEDGLFPFWAFTLPEVEGEAVRRVFGGIYKSNQLVIPAFAIPSFEAMFRLSKRMSSALAKIPSEQVDSFSGRFLPVSLPHSTARLLAEVIVYRDMAQRDHRTSFDKVNLHPTGVRLIYVPFHPEHYFYVDSVLNAVTFEKTLVD